MGDNFYIGNRNINGFKVQRTKYKKNTFMNAIICYIILQL